VALRYDPLPCGSGCWAPSTLAPGQELRPPEALFRKLEPSVVDEEIERMMGGG
jgi:hypothetical protein